MGLPQWLSGKESTYRAEVGSSLGWEDPLEKETTEDEMVGWHHQIHGHKFEQALRNVDGQGSLACCSLWGHKELDMTEQLNHHIYIHTHVHTIMAKSEEELKSLLMKVKEESKNVGLKLNIQKSKIMASGPITSWQIEGETVADFILGGPKLLQMEIAIMKLKDAYSLEGKL